LGEVSDYELVLTVGFSDGTVVGRGWGFDLEFVGVSELTLCKKLAAITELQHL
jgi:hypothetical protein